MYGTDGMGVSAAVAAGPVTLRGSAQLELLMARHERDRGESMGTAAKKNQHGGGFRTEHPTRYATAIHADSFEWLAKAEPNSISAVVTDPPYGLTEYTEQEQRKMKAGKGGIWRIPPKLDGAERRPLPRFSVMTRDDHADLKTFFERLAKLLMPVLKPGAHVFIATNPLVSHLVYGAFIEQGFEKRGEIIRIVHTLRGGDRPKNAHEEFADVTVMPKSCWEPWGLFRKPCEGRVQDNLRKWKTGGLRRISADEPFKDLVEVAPARGRERELADHPSIKPQALMRQFVRASLPLGEGTILDPFMGSGSTLAAASACGLQCLGVERDEEYFEMAVGAIPKLAALDLRAKPSRSERRDDE